MISGKRYIYNNSNSDVVNLYNTKLFNDLFKEDKVLMSKVSKPQNKSESYKMVDSYYYNQTDKYANELNRLWDIRLNKYIFYSEDEIDTFTLRRNINTISDKYMTNLSIYINSLNILPYKIGNGFCDMWSILSNIPELIPDVDTFNTFHSGELPGNFILAIERFIKNNHKNIKYDWLAQGLNPDKKENKEKYGNYFENIYGDDFNLVENNKHRWLWGIDNTGDINSIDNIKWYDNYINKFLGTRKLDLNLVTCDAEYVGSYDTMQHLDFAQMLQILATSRKGCNCILGIWATHIRKNDKSTKSNGFYLNIIQTIANHYEYIYLIKPVSAPGTKFYLVGINCKDNIDMDKYYNLYNKLYKSSDSINQCWIKKEDINKDLKNKYINFLETIYKDAVERSHRRLILLFCYDDIFKTKYKKIKCSELLNINNTMKKYETIFKKWVKKYKIY
jgi:hypothetical protein